MKPFLEITPEGVLRFNFHRSQARAMKSERRFIAIVAGTQGGKTCVGPAWLHREMIRRGPGDYLVVSPTYKLLDKKALPEFLRLFRDLLGLGIYRSSDKVFVVTKGGERKLFGAEQNEPTTVFFGYAEDPESLESATAKAAWLDEAGQRKFKLGSWEAILRRLSIHMGRCLITTTPYDLGWLKRKLYDPWKAGDETIEFVRFASKDNPMFPQDEWERAKRDLPRWKFDLFYRGVFTRPAGVIYDAFDEDQDTCPRFRIPRRWYRYVGLDFGGVNTTALFYAQEPGSPKLYLYREYKAGSRTAAAHIESLRSPDEQREENGFVHPDRTAGGSMSEQQWRDEFAAAGLGVEGPDFADVEVGIDRVYGFHARREIVVFDDCEGYLEEKATYRRALDDADQPTAKIEDKSQFHFMDAERYILSKLAPTQGEEPISVEYDYEEVGGFVL